MKDELFETIIAFLVVILIFFIIVAVVKGWFFHSKDSMKNKEDNTRYIVNTGGDPSLGNESAPLTFIVFEDFECSVCKRFTQEAEPLLIKEYVDTGKMRFVFKNFPLISIHPGAFRDALAAECAQDQDMFWEYYHLLYNSTKKLEIGVLQDYAQEAGMNITLFNKCFMSEQHKDDVNRDYNDGIQNKVTGSPTFFVNGKRILGYSDYDALKKIIDEELAAKEGEE